MSADELKLYNKLSWLQQKVYLKNAYAAETAAKSFPGLHNGLADAFRHAYFSALNARSFGIILTKLLGDAHENDINQPFIEGEMDLHNNNQGREAYRTLQQSAWTVSREDLYSQVLFLMNSGALWYIFNGQLVKSHSPATTPAPVPVN